MMLLPILLFASSLRASEPRTGWGWAALPTPNYDSDNGFGYGAFAAVYNYGPEGPGEDPYKAKIAAQFFQTTRWYMDHFVDLDFPSLLHTRLRWDLKAEYEAWDHANYFGRGNFLPRLQDADLPNELYDQYALNSAKTLTNLRIPIRGDWEALVSYRFRLAWPDPYPDSMLEHLQPVGYDGGFYSQLSAGVVYDSRDREPSPTAGMFTEVSLSTANPLIGSRFSVVGANFTDRRFYSLVSNDRLVLANRFIADFRSGDVPFFEDWVLGGTQAVEIGGELSMRGLDAGRYRDDLILMLDPELRWTFLHTSVLKKNTLDIMAVPFADVCRVWAFEKEEPDAITHLHYTGGLGARFAWNDNFLVRLDVAYGVEEYAPLGTTPSQVESNPIGVDPDEVVRQPNLGFYLTFDHPY
jgi:hypothetical protein